MIIIVPLLEPVGQVGDLRVYKERSLADWLRDYLPEGTEFSISSFELDGDEARAKVIVRVPPVAQRVDIQINAVDL